LNASVFEVKFGNGRKRPNGGAEEAVLNLRIAEHRFYLEEVFSEGFGTAVFSKIAERIRFDHLKKMKLSRNASAVPAGLPRV